VVQLPVREADGRLKLVPALLPRSQDTAADYLALTPRLLLQQAFKFLGERYGWGHDYDTRDCSGFVSEIYRSFGVLPSTPWCISRCQRCGVTKVYGIPRVARTPSTTPSERPKLKELLTPCFGIACTCSRKACA